MIAIVSVGYLCSFGGFKQLIGIMYPILGYMGILLLVILLFGWIRERDKIILEKFLRRKMIRLSLKNQHPDTNTTKKEEKLFHRFGEISKADSTNLKNDVREVASKIIENTDNIKDYADNNLAVDDEKLKNKLSN